MNTTDLGRLGEVKVMARLVELGWYVFTDISGKCPVDLVAWKDGTSISIQVKSTSTKTGTGYTVGISRSRPNRTETVIHKFDSSESDYLAVYIQPLDKVCFIPSKSINTGREITLREDKSKFSNRESWIISSYEDISPQVS